MAEILSNRTISNPLDEEFRFRWDKVEYVIPPRSTMSYVGYLAEHAAKKLADKILIQKGRFEDVIRNDKIIGHAVSMGERVAVKEALLDREEKYIDLDAIVINAKAKPAKVDHLPVGEVAAVVEEKPVGTIQVTPPEGEPVEDSPPEKDNKSRFAELKEKGWVRLNKDEKKEYQELKKIFDT